MPHINVSIDCLRAIKEYLVDVEGMTIGEFVEGCVFFVMGDDDRLEDFEDSFGIEETEEDAEDETEEESPEEE